MSNIHVAHTKEHVIPGKRLGRHLEHDPASRMFAHAETVPSGLKSVYWQRYGGPFDQGDLGSCTGNAITGACMTDPIYVAGRTLTETEAVHCYQLATHLDNIDGAYPPDDTGSSGLAACKAAVRLGWISRYTHAFSMAAVLSAMQHGPVIAGINWYSSFDQPDTHGVVAIDKHATIRGGHEVQAYKLDLTFHADGSVDLAKSQIWFWNSWGTSYGLGGAFGMSLATFGRLLNEGGDVTVPHK